MPRSSRKRQSLVLLLVLAAGLAAAFASAADARAMMCCAEGMEEPGCTWLGAGDCCSEAPAAPAPSNATPPASAGCSGLVLSAPDAAPVAISPCALAVPRAHGGLRTTVLRL